MKQSLLASAIALSLALGVTASAQANDPVLPKAGPAAVDAKAAKLKAAGKHSAMKNDSLGNVGKSSRKANLSGGVMMQDAGQKGDHKEPKGGGKDKLMGGVMMQDVGQKGDHKEPKEPKDPKGGKDKLRGGAMMQDVGQKGDHKEIKGGGKDKLTGGAMMKGPGARPAGMAAQDRMRAGSLGNEQMRGAAQATRDQMQK